MTAASDTTTAPTPTDVLAALNRLEDLLAAAGWLTMHDRVKFDNAARGLKALLQRTVIESEERNQ
jgi:hypothetical protein